MGLSRDLVHKTAVRAADALLNGDATSPQTQSQLVEGQGGEPSAPASLPARAPPIARPTAVPVAPLAGSAGPGLWLPTQESCRQPSTLEWVLSWAVRGPGDPKGGGSTPGVVVTDRKERAETTTSKRGQCHSHPP